MSARPAPRRARATGAARGGSPRAVAASRDCAAPRLPLSTTPPVQRAPWRGPFPGASPPALSGPNLPPADRPPFPPPTATAGIRCAEAGARTSGTTRCGGRLGPWWPLLLRRADREALAPLGTPALQHGAALPGTHPLAEPVLAIATDLARLIRAPHHCLHAVRKKARHLSTRNPECQAASRRRFPPGRQGATGSSLAMRGDTRASRSATRSSNSPLVASRRCAHSGTLRRALAANRWGRVATAHLGWFEGGYERGSDYFERDA